MADTVEASIQEALFARVRDLVLSPALPIAWPNVPFKPPGNHRYLRVQFVPNTVDRPFIASNDVQRLLGLLQVSVYWTKGRGEEEPREIAGAVAAHFPTDLVMRSGSLAVRTTRRPEVRDLIVEDAAVQIPVIMRWEAWA